MEKLVDKLVDECTENIDEVKIVESTLTENTLNAVLAYFTMCCFQ